MAVIIEDICIRKGEVCENPIYLTWKNTLGGWDYWLFQFKQLYSDNVEVTGDFERFFDDLSSQNTVTDWLKKNNVESILIGDDQLTTSEAKGLREITYSPKIYMFVEWLGSPQIPIWKTVKIEPGTFKVYQSDKNQHSAEFEIFLPRQNTLSN
jgi:hypothetical protein